MPSVKKTVKLDQDTKKVLTEQEKIKRLTEQDGWIIVEKLFLSEAAKLLNMADVNIDKPIGGSLSIELGIRQLASAKILSILNDIKGTAQQFDMNSKLTEQIEEGYILRLPTKR